MTRRQEEKLKAMGLPEKEEVAVREIIDLLDREVGADDELKCRVIATLNHYMQAEGFYD